VLEFSDVVHRLVEENHIEAVGLEIEPIEVGASVRNTLETLFLCLLVGGNYRAFGNIHSDDRAAEVFPTDITLELTSAATDAESQLERLDAILELEPLHGPLVGTTGHSLVDRPTDQNFTHPGRDPAMCECCGPIAVGPVSLLRHLSRLILR